MFCVQNLNEWKKSDRTEKDSENNQPVTEEEPVCPMFVVTA